MTTHNNTTNNGGWSRSLSQPPQDCSVLQEDFERKNQKKNRRNQRKVDTNKCERKEDEQTSKATNYSEMTDNNNSNTKTQGNMSSFSKIPNLISTTLISISGQVTKSKKGKGAQQIKESPPKQEPTDYKNSDIDKHQKTPQKKETTNRNKENQSKGTEKESNISKSTSNQENKIDGAKQSYQSLTHSSTVIKNSEISKDFYTQHTPTENLMQITQNKQTEFSGINKNKNKSTSGASKNDTNMTQNGTSQSKKSTIESTRNQNNTTTDPKSLPMHHKSTIKSSSQKKKVEYTGMENNDNMPISDSSKINDKKLTDNSPKESKKDKSKASKNNQTTASNEADTAKTNPINDKKLTDNSQIESKKDKSESTSNHENNTTDQNCSQESNKSTTEISTQNKEVEILEKDKNKEKPLSEASKNNQTTEGNEADTDKKCPTKTIDFMKEVEREAEDLCIAVLSDTLIDLIYFIIDEIAKNGLKNINFLDHFKRSFWDSLKTLIYGIGEGSFTIFCKWVATKSVKLAHAEILGGKLGIGELMKLIEDLYEGRKTKWEILREVIAKILVKLALYCINYLIPLAFGPLGYWSVFALSIGLGVAKKFVNKLVF